MSERKIKIQSGKKAVWMDITEEEHQRYYRPWWQQKKREQRNREAMEKNGYTEESYEGWRDSLSENMGVPDFKAADMDELLEKKMLLGVLEEALDSLVLEERELAVMVFGEEMSVCEFARMKGENRRTLAFRKNKVLEKLQKFFKNRGFDI
nr:sigma-70 family RNA polymerase sigma factor [uncultured Eisenbergiella sp.]